MPMKRRSEVFALTLVVLGMLTAVSAATASAVELPEFTVESASTSTSGKSTLSIGNTKISCAGSAGSSSPLSKKLSKFSFSLTTCKLGGEQCHSLGDAAGTILVTGEYHLVRGTKAEEALLWILFVSVHFECLFAETLITLRGNLLGALTPINLRSRIFHLVKSLFEGKQAITRFTNNEGAEVEAKLEGSLNGGEFKSATEQSEANSFTTEKETEITHTK